MKKIIAIVCVLIFGAVAFFSVASATHPCFKIFDTFKILGISCDHLWGGGLHGYLTTNPDPVKPEYAANGKAGPTPWEEVWNWNADGFDVAHPDNYIPIDNLRAMITSIPSNRYIEPQLHFTQILPKELERLVHETKKTVLAKKGPIDLTGYVSKNGGPITFNVALTARVLDGRRRFVRKKVAEGLVSNKRIDTGTPHIEIAGVIPSNLNEVQPLSPITGKSGICAVKTRDFGDYDNVNRMWRWRNDVAPVPVKVLLSYEDDHTPNDSGVAAVKFDGDMYQYGNKTWMPFTVEKWIEVLLTPGPGFKIIKVIASDNSLNYTSDYTSGNALPGHVSSEEDGGFVVEVLNCLPGKFPLPKPLLPLPTSMDPGTANSDADNFLQTPVYPGIFPAQLPLSTSMYQGAMNGDASAGGASGE